MQIYGSALSKWHEHLTIPTFGLSDITKSTKQMTIVTKSIPNDSRLVPTEYPRISHWSIPYLLSVNVNLRIFHRKYLLSEILILITCRKSHYSSFIAN